MMKIIIFIMLSLFLISCEESKEVKKSSDSSTVEKSKLDDLSLEDEDCDEKFKKAQTKPIDESNLFNQNGEQDEGCTLD